jgi:transcription termination factor Rho
MRTGDTIEGKIRPPKDSERYFAMLKVDKINFDLLAKRTKFIFYTAWELANREKRIELDKK